jgi:hypothetical protein
VEPSARSGPLTRAPRRFPCSSARAENGARVAQRGRPPSRGRDGSASLRKRRPCNSSAHRKIVAMFVWALMSRGEQAGAEALPGKGMSHDQASRRRRDACCRAGRTLDRSSCHRESRRPRPSPKQLNFGSQPVSSQTTETVTVTNTGTETVTIIGAILQGGPVFDWNQAQVDLNTCAMVVGTLAPGASCTAPILFAPTEQGHFRGT